MEPFKVVAHFIDDIIVKGFVYNFDPACRSCNLYQGSDDRSLQNPIILGMKEIKALFFVKDFDGNHQYPERKEFMASDRVLGRKMEITFVDGEKIQGSSLDYDPKRMGFFLIPADEDCNNIQIFVVTNAVMNIRFL